MKRNAEKNASYLPGGDVQLHDLQTSSRATFVKHRSQEKQDLPHGKEWFMNAHFSIGTEDAARPVPTTRETFQQPNRGAYPEHISKDNNASHMPSGERRVNPYTTTQATSFKEPTNIVENPNTHPSAWLRATHFQNGNEAETLNYHTTVKDTYGKPERNAYQYSKINGSDLNRSALPLGDASKIRMVDTSFKSDFVDHGLQAPSQMPRSVEWSRATHFSLGEDPRADQQSVFRQDFPLHDPAAYANKQRYAVGQSDIPAGDSHTRVYETTSKATFRNHAGARPASLPNTPHWLRDTHFEMGDGKVDFDRLPEIASTTNKTEFRAPDREAILNKHVKKTMNVSSVPMGDNREDTLKTRNRMDYPTYQSTIPNQPLEAPERLKATHFDLGTDPSMAVHSTSQQHYQHPGNSYPDRNKVVKNVSSIPFGDKEKAAAPKSTALNDFAAPPTGNWRGSQNPSLRSATIRLGE